VRESSLVPPRGGGDTQNTEETAGYGRGDCGWTAEALGLLPK